MTGPASPRAGERPVVVTLEGELDISTLPEAQARVAAAEARLGRASQRAPASEERSPAGSRPSDTEARLGRASQRAPASEESSPAASRPSDTEADAPTVLVIDLSQLAFVDSSGVRLVLLAVERASAQQWRVAVRLGIGPALRIFQALGLTDKLDVVDE